MSNTSSCERADELIGFLYGELDEADARRFDRHLRECAACESEFKVFGQIHTSIVEWRNESLGTRSPAFSEAPVLAQAPQASVRSRPSAIMALREFFVLSPLWMKGAAAIAAILFCICAMLAVRYLQSQPSAPGVVKQNSDKIYTQGELDNQVARAIARTHEETETAERQRKEEVAKNQPSPRRPVANVPTSPGIAGNPRRPFTQQEREELAADLRLVTAKDEEDLDITSDSSRPTP
jgi:hypothetical protein